MINNNVTRTIEGQRLVSGIFIMLLPPLAIKDIEIEIKLGVFTLLPFDTKKYLAVIRKV